MARRNLPPLQSTPAPKAGDVPAPSRVHAHEADPPPAPAGHNLLSLSQAQLLRGSIQSLRSIQRQIDELNGQKGGVYDVLREAEIDPALVRKVVYRLGLSQEETAKIEERDLKLAAYLDAVADLRNDGADEE